MGVPGLFNWLVEKYPNIVEKLNQQNKFVCDYFYLDMNGIIHPCCHPEGKLRPKNEKEMIEFMHRYLDMLLEYIEPKQLIYIAVDGPPPRAKMMQQRERRFIHAQESKQNDKSWDSNKITPGTKFMKKVKHGLIKYIKQKLQNHNNKNLKIILSDSSVAGEGEHKILDFIRNRRYKGNYKSSNSHLLFSNDADMLLLSLLLHETNIYLMRDIPVRGSRRSSKSIFATKFNLIHIKQLTKYLSIELSPQTLKYQRFTYDFDRIIDDFVFLSYLMGNDFIPCLPFMNVRDGAYQYLLQKYIEIASKLPSYLTNGKEINFEAVSVYLDKLAKEECDILKYRSLCFSADSIVEKQTKMVEMIFCESKTESAQVRDNSISDAGFIAFGKKGYKKRYYQKKFKVDSLKSINDINLQYIRALSWIQHYYYSGIISWTWFYQQHFAPLLSDVAICCRQNDLSGLWNNNEKGHPLSPLSQLALIMPKKSAKRTLPSVYFDAIFGENSNLKEYYPDTFEMDLNFKAMHWESTALLTHVNVDLLEKVLETKKNELNEEYKTLDMFGHHILFIQSKADMEFYIHAICKEWGVLMVDDLIDLKLEICEINFELANTLDMCKANRKCVLHESDEKEEDLNMNEMKIVSQTMCKYFMSGKKIPSRIAKYMKNRPNLWKRSVNMMRKSTEFSIQDRISKGLKKEKRINKSTIVSRHNKQDSKLLFQAWSMSQDKIFQPSLDCNVSCINKQCGGIHYKQINDEYVAVICHFVSCKITDSTLISLSCFLRITLFDLYQNLKGISFINVKENPCILLQVYLERNDIKWHGLSTLLNVLSFPFVYVEYLSLSGNILLKGIGANLIAQYLGTCWYLPHRINLCQVTVSNEDVKCILHGMLKRGKDKICLIDLEKILKIMGEIEGDIICGVVIEDEHRAKLYVPLTIYVDKSIDTERLALSVNENIFICTGADYKYIGHGECDENYCSVSATMSTEENLNVSALPAVHLFVGKTGNTKQ